MSGHLVEEVLNRGGSLMNELGFSPEQTAELQKQLDRSLVKQRPGPGGKKLSYIEGYVAIRIANEVFGFDGWSYNIENIMPVEGGVIVHIRLRVGNVFREEVGFGDGNVELAYKEAVTDALKRALRTFGDRFALDLYDKDSELHKPERPAPKPVTAADLCPKHNVQLIKGRTGLGHVMDDGSVCMKEELVNARA